MVWPPDPSAVPAGTQALINRIAFLRGVATQHFRGACHHQLWHDKHDRHAPPCLCCVFHCFADKRWHVFHCWRVDSKFPVFGTIRGGGCAIASRWFVAGHGSGTGACALAHTIALNGTSSASSSYRLFGEITTGNRSCARLSEFLKMQK